MLDLDPFVLADETPSDILNGRILMTSINGECFAGGEVFSVEQAVADEQ